MEDGSAEDKPIESQHDDNVGNLDDSHSYQVELITQITYLFLFSSICLAPLNCANKYVHF